MIYFLIPICLLLFGIRYEYPDKKHLHSVMFSISLIILILFAGLRGDIEPDYISYKDIYDKAGQSINANVEIGYYLFNVVMHSLGLGFQWVIFFCAIFSLVPKFYFFKNHSSNYFIVLAFYYCSVFFLFDFIAIRQAIAIGIFMVSIPFIIERKISIYLFLIMIASLFHLSALVLVPLYFIMHRSFSKLLMFCLLVVCSIINILKVKIGLLDYLLSFVSLPGFAAAKMDIYSLDDEFAALSIKQLVLGFLFVFYADKFKSNSILKALLNAYILGVLIATFLNDIPQFAYRIKSYFLWADVILLVEIVRIWSKSNKRKTIPLYILFVAFYCYTLYGFLDSISQRGIFKDFIYPYVPFVWPIF
ncbi:MULTISPECIES: EpsG family protein [Sphingobacterium]|uniref:EpsG family protein n=1 Tax=Sphingobacterium TaxID=28453 RepID=UPI002580429F|nr:MULTISPECIES: EpsG family protein [Sphingobacterium]